MSATEVIYGGCETDLFDGPGPGHRTYKADGHWLTGVESWDSETFCDLRCAEVGLLGLGYTRSEDEDFWWIKQADGTYNDATVYDDVDFRDEMAPYVCAGCGETLYEAPDND